MATDTKRLCGPKDCYNPNLFIPESEKILRHTEIENCERQNGRGLEKARPLYLKAGLISQANGSAYVEMEQTKVIAAVYGPTEVMRREDFSLLGQLTCEFKLATFSCRVRRSAMQDAEEKELSVLLIESIEPAVCLHKFPKAQFSICITVLQNDGGVLQAAVNCASLALADAGVEMYDLVTSCSAKIIGEQILLDPSLHEEITKEDASEENVGLVHVSLMPSLNQVTTLSAHGHLNIESLTKGTKLCTEVCERLYAVQRQCLVKDSANAAHH